MLRKVRLPHFLLLAVALFAPPTLAGCGSGGVVDQPRVSQAFPVTVALWDQTSPAIAGSTVVWQGDGERGATVEGCELTEMQPLELAARPPKGQAPAVSTALCVWSADSQARIGRTELPTSSIRGVSLESRKPVDVFSRKASRLGFPTAALQPAVSGQTVVWADLTVARFRSVMLGAMDKGDLSADIWMRDLRSNQERSVCTARGDQIFPDVDGSLVAWEDWRHVRRSGAKSGNADIYAALLHSRAEIPVCTKKGQQALPAVSGTRVVWMDRRHGNWDIYGYDVLSGEEFPVCVAPGNQTMPDISGNLVVWADYRTGSGDIYGRDLGGGGEFPICIDGAAQDSPAASNGTVVWADKRNGTWDIYGAKVRLSATQATLRPSQTTSTGSGTTPAPGGSAAIPWEDAAKHVGDRVTLEGPVVSAVYVESSSGEPTFLNVGKDYPDPDRLSVVIWGEDRPAFPSAPERMYDGQTVRVSGVVRLYEGVAQIEVTLPDALEIAQ